MFTAGLKLRKGSMKMAKPTAKSWLQKEELTEEVWEQHLAGKQSIGCVPIKPNNMVSWGAIDIDLYQEQLNMESILKRSPKRLCHLYCAVPKAEEVICTCS